tara:strand:- start:3645 stop:4325 length:681 start_codon:yes stop_codon:yes gene_type:complete
VIFPHIQLENIIQENDKTRIDVARSFANSETIDIYEISVDNEATYIDVTTDMVLDWAFDAFGVYPIFVKLTGSVSGAITFSKNLMVKTAEEDNLFSNDDELVQHEDDILNYVREGRSTFLDKHRLAQNMILNDLDKNQIWKDDGTRYIASDIVDTQEFSEWSKFMVLRIVMESLSNDIQDIFHEKAVRYRTMEVEAKKRACLRLDSNGDGEINEKVNLISGVLTRG